MIGLLLIYFIGKSFYSLAVKYNKSKWGFAVLGILSYYLGTFIAGIFMGLIDLFAGTSITLLPTIAIGLIALPFGLLSCWGLHGILKSQWNKKPKLTENSLLDDNILNNS